MEDDADYDVRIKSQLMDFASATRLLLQPMRGTSKSLDPTNPRKSKDDQPHDISIDDPRHITSPTSSPYGDIDRWDILWLGHCGSPPAEARFPGHALGRVVKQNDPTAIRPQHYNPLPNGDKKIWPRYPNNTRLFFHAHTPGCNLAYGINRDSARMLLYQLGIKNMTGFSDITMHKICNGDYILNSEHKFERRRCMSVLPPLFSHHYPYAYPRRYTDNIRFGARANFPVLVNKQANFVDAFPDEEPMAMYFSNLFAKGRYQKFLDDPEGERRKEEDHRGVLKAVKKLEELEKQGKEEAAEALKIEDAEKEAAANNEWDFGKGEGEVVGTLPEEDIPPPQPAPGRRV